MSEVKIRTNREMWLGEFSRGKLVKKKIQHPVLQKKKGLRLMFLVSTLSKSHIEETAKHDSAYFQLSPALGKRREEDYEFKCKKILSHKKKENSNEEGEVELL